MSDKDFFEEELNKEIKRLDKESTKHKKLFRKIKYSIFAFTGLSTLLAGIAIGSEAIQQYLNVGVVLFTSAIGIATSIEGLRKPGELWIMERNLYYSLIDLKRTFYFDLAQNEKNIDVKEYFDNMQRLLNSAGEKRSKHTQNLVAEKKK